MTAVAAPARTVIVTVHVANHYATGTVHTAAENVTIPAPGDDLDGWASAHLFPLTGAGLPGPAWYEVEVTGASDPVLTGRRFEFG